MNHRRARRATARWACASSSSTGSERSRSATSSVAIAVAAHRGPALDACRYVIESSSGACRSGSGSTTRTARASGSDDVRTVHGPRTRSIAAHPSNDRLAGARCPSTSSAAASSTCASRSPTAATSGACTACRRKGLPWLPKAEILTYEEIAEVVGQLAPLGLRRLPHHRRRADDPPEPRALDSHAACDSGIEDIALSTNGRASGRWRRPARRGPRSREHERRFLRPDRIAAIARRDLGFDHRPRRSRRTRGTRADQDQRRRDARHQRRRGRGLRAADDGAGHGTSASSSSCRWATCAS